MELKEEQLDNVLGGVNKEVATEKAVDNQELYRKDAIDTMLNDTNKDIVEIEIPMENIERLKTQINNAGAINSMLEDQELNIKNDNEKDKKIK